MFEHSPFYRQANAAWEAGVIDKFFFLDEHTKALIVATHEARNMLEFLSSLDDGDE